MVRKGSTFGSKKSSFSRKSSRSGDNNNDSNFGSDKKEDAITQKAYIFRINSDFDIKKTYEETVLRIMNEMCRTKVTEP